MLNGTADGVTNKPHTAQRTLANLRALASSRATIYLPSHDPGSPRRLAKMQPAVARESHTAPATAIVQ